MIEINVRMCIIEFIEFTNGKCAPPLFNNVLPHETNKL